jgi:hypothetical protein
MPIGSQYQLTHGERDSLTLLESPSLTGHIQTHGASCPRRLRASKPQDKDSQRDLEEPRLPPLVMGHKTAQAFPVQPECCLVNHTVADSETLVVTNIYVKYITIVSPGDG